MPVMLPTRAEGCSCNRVGGRNCDSHEKRVPAQRPTMPVLSGLVERDEHGDALRRLFPITP